MPQTINYQKSLDMLKKILSVTSVFCLICSVNLMGQEGYDSYTFTEQDSLRGSLSILRSSYDVRFYDLDLTVDMDSESISGSVGIDFDVLEDLSQIQLDLFEKNSL